LKKDELITFVSESAEITKKSAGDAINAALEGIASALEKGDITRRLASGTYSSAGLDRIALCLHYDLLSLLKMEKSGKAIR